MKFIEELRQKQKDDIFGLANTKKIWLSLKTKQKLRKVESQKKKLRAPHFFFGQINKSYGTSRIRMFVYSV